jgi:flagellin
MSLVLNTNIDSLVAQNNLTSSGSQLATSLQQLSSGLRINSAADDAAGYAISQGMTSQINGMNQASQNANDGVSLAQTASGALQGIVNDLQSMRDLAVESLNASNGANDRADLNAQFQQLMSDINSVSTQTQFNGVNLLDGSFQGATFQVGANAGQSITMASIASTSSSAIGDYFTGALSVAGSVNTAAGATVNTTAGTAGSYSASTLEGATGLNSASVNGYTVNLNVTVNGGTAVQAGPITLTGTASTDLKSIAAAINQALSSTGGLVATVNSNDTGVTISGTSASGTGNVVNFSVASATDSAGNAVTAGAATLAALGVDSSDTVGYYTPTTGGTAASTTPTTAGAYNATTLGTDLDGSGTLASGTPASLVLGVQIGAGAVVDTGPISIDGTQATDTAAIVGALNTTLAGSGFTAAAGANGVTITGSGATNQTVTFSVVSGTDADGTTAVTPSAGLLTALGVDASDAYTAAVAGTPGSQTTSSSAQYLSGLNVSTVDKSNQVLISIDNALQQIATASADLGAYQNRFQSAITALTTDSTNLTSAKSAITDTDYAQATSNLSKAQILQQASTAMVAQANTIPQNILTLLQKLP